MAGAGYKKYMKKNARKDYSIVKLFAITFFGMIIVFTLLIQAFSPQVDTTIGDEQREIDSNMETASVDGRLTSIQEEDTGRSFTDLIKKADDVSADTITETASYSTTDQLANNQKEAEVSNSQPDTFYKVYIGSYSSAEQAKVDSDIIRDSNLGLTPIVKCLGSNNYTLQVGSYKNRARAEVLLSIIQQNHFAGRIIQEN